MPRTTTKHSLKSSCHAYFLLAVGLLGVPFLLAFVYYSNTPITSYHQSSKTQEIISEKLISVATTKSRHKSTQTRTKEGRYLIVPHYHYQLSGALESFAILVGVSVALKRQPLVPFIFKSRMYGIPATNEYIQLNEFFLLSRIERNLRQCLLHAPPNFSLITLEEWVSTVQSKDLTTVEIFSPEGHGGKEEIIDCDRHNVKMQKDLKKSIEYLNQYANRVVSPVQADQITVVKRVCVFALEVNIQALASHVSDDSTVVISFYEYSVRPKISKIESVCPKNKAEYKRIEYCCNIMTWPVSNRVMLAAQDSSLQMGLDKPYIAVHVRIERLVSHYQNIIQSLQCVEKLKQVLATIQDREKSYPNQTILVHDMGEYGTDNCENDECYPDAMKVLTELRKIRLREFHYKPRGGDIQDRGFVALVEREVEIGADILVAMGGGHFQESLRNRFLLTHNAKSLFTVCI